MGSFQGINTILCADWGKETRKRAVYAADVRARRVYRLQPKRAWSLPEILDAADGLSANGPVLAAFDVPFGVPNSYLAAWKSLKAFLDLLQCACSTPGFFDATRDAANWKVEQPFFSVPGGKGGLTSYINAAAKQGIDLCRSIDKRTKAKSLFIKSGIPGSVGSAACSLWAEIGPLLQSGRSFGVWPFDGDLGSLLQSCPVVLGEMYPRAAYATALSDSPIELRAPMSLAKTDSNIRHSAIEAMKAARWVQEHDVQLEDLSFAQATEDDFDACITVAALLRCQLDQVPFSEAWVASDRIEGGILGTASINLGLNERTFGNPHWSEHAFRPSQRSRTPASPSRSRIFTCPIAGCERVFQDTRCGWDGHVGSPRIHPLWHPEISDAQERKRQFASDFRDFFCEPGPQIDCPHLPKKP